MDCEYCKTEMLWVGNMRDGGMECPICTPKKKPTKICPYSIHDEGTWPDNLRWRPPAGWECQCCCCGEWYELYCDITEFEEGDQYCGGQPRCCP